MSILDNFDVVGVPRTFSIAEVRILKNRISFNLATASEIGYPHQQTDIENKIDIALTTAVHELIEYLRYQDIQALDEEEFLLRVRELIRVEQDERLPF